MLTWHMLRGMAIPGDRVEEEEGISKVLVQTVIGHSPDFIPGKTRKRRKTREAFYKGYGVV